MISLRSGDNAILGSVVEISLHYWVPLKIQSFKQDEARTNNIDAAYD